MDNLELFKRIIENFKSMTLKEALKKEHIGTKLFNSLVTMFPKEAEEYYGIRNKKRRAPRPFALKNFSEDQIKAIISSYKEGKTLQEIATELNTSPLVIKRNLIRYNVPLRSKEDINKIQSNKKCLVKNDMEWEKIYKDYLKERAIYKICNKYRVDLKTIIKNFKRLGLFIPKLTSNIKYETKFGTRYLYSSDWSDLFSYYETHGIKEVEEFFGINRKRIYNIFKKLGYPRRTCGEERELIKYKNGEDSFKRLLETLQEYTVLEGFKGYVKEGKYLKYTFKHNKCGRTFKRTLHDPLNIRCVHCYPKSKGENFISNLLSGIEVIQGDRSLIAPQELDFHLPLKKVAIEYNGRYWHNELIVPKEYHKEKTEKCLEKGVNLYHFWEGQDTKIIESRINQILGKSERIYARKTIVSYTLLKERKEFFNRTHLSGDTNSLFAVGLYYKYKLTACMSFRKCREGIEIARYSSELNTSVVGGFSKLLKFAISYIRTHYEEIDKIITYCNRDLTPDYKDSVYYKNGFTFIKDTGPIMSYYNQNTGKTESREKYQKHKLKKLFLNYNGENVNDFLKSKGIVRMYNSGNWKFEMRLK